MQSKGTKIILGIVIVLLIVGAMSWFVRSSTNEDQFYHRLFAVSAVGALVFSILGPIIKDNRRNK